MLPLRVAASALTRVVAIGIPGIVTGVPRQTAGAVYEGGEEVVQGPAYDHVVVNTD